MDHYLSPNRTKIVGKQIDGLSQIWFHLFWMVKTIPFVSKKVVMEEHASRKDQPFIHT